MCVAKWCVDLKRIRIVRYFARFRPRPGDELSAALTGKPTSTDLPPRTTSSAFASQDHSHWIWRWLERAGLALPERDSLCRCTRFFGDGSDASAPALSNRPQWWRLIQEYRHSAARPKKFREPPHRETLSRLAAICDTFHTEMRKGSCPAPAPPQGLRNTATNEPTASRIQRLTISDGRGQKQLAITSRVR